MGAYLPALAQQVGHGDPGDPPAIPEDRPFALADVYDEEIEAKTQDVYQRDYLMFGFGSWK